ncbi:hypothetical protein D3C84_853470 [compost metagenome]
MLGTEHRDQWLAHQFDHVEAIRQPERAHDPDFNRLVHQRIGHLGAAHFPQVQVHRREALAKRENRLGDGRVEGGRRGEADLQFAQLAQLCPPRDIRRFGDLRQRQSRLFEEQPTGFAQFDPTIGTFKKPCADFLFQRLNLLAQRWLRDAQHLCGAAEVQFFGDGDEVAQMTQFHGNPIRSLKLSNRSNNILD